MSFALKGISYIIDLIVVKLENFFKGRRRHVNRNLVLAKYNRPVYFKRPEKFYNRGLRMPDMQVAPRLVRGGVKMSNYSFLSETESGYPENDVVVGRIFEVRESVFGKSGNMEFLQTPGNPS